MSDKIVAQVNGKKISQADVMKFVDEIGPEVAMQFQSADGIIALIEEMVAQELLVLDAKANDLDKEEEFQRVLNETRDNLLKSYSFSKIMSQVFVSDEEVKDFFEKNKDVFLQETVSAKHILVESEDQATEIKVQIDKGLDFDQAARMHSTCPSKDKGGDLGTFTRGQMVKEFEEVAFSQDIGKVSDPVKTQFGYHLILTTGKKDSEDISFEEIADSVKSEALRLKQLEAYQSKINQLKIQYDYEIFE